MCCNAPEMQYPIFSGAVAVGVSHISRVVGLVAFLVGCLAGIAGMRGTPAPRKVARARARALRGGRAEKEHKPHDAPASRGAPHISSRPKLVGLGGNTRAGASDISVVRVEWG